MAEITAGRDVNVLRDSRKSSLMTQEDMAKHMGWSVPTIVDREKDPEKLTLGELSKWYSAVGTDARVWIKDYVGSFFLD